MANTVQQIKAKESQLKSQWASLWQSTNQQVTPKNTKQIGQAWSTTWAGSTVWLQTMPNLIPETKNEVKSVNNAEQSKVGTGAVAWMYTAPNFLQEANNRIKQNELNQLAVNQKKQNNLNYKWSLAIPGKVAPVSSAKYIKNIVYKILNN